jgi:predicted DNA-binding protein (UPF0251 family)
MWTREDLAWAAGLIEGEGCIFARTPGPNRKTQGRNFFVTVAMTDEDVIRKLHGVLKVGTVTGPYFSKQPRRKPRWAWQTNTFEAGQAVAAAIWPWLCSRRRARIKEALAIYHSADVKHKTPPRKIVYLAYEAVERMRQLRADGMPQHAIAKQFGVSQSTVSKIIRGHRWKAA